MFEWKFTIALVDFMLIVQTFYVCTFIYYYHYLALLWINYEFKYKLCLLSLVNDACIPLYTILVNNGIWLNIFLKVDFCSFLPQRVPVVRRTRQPSMFFRDVTDTNQSESHSGHQQLRFTRNYMGAWRTWKRPPTSSLLLDWLCRRTRRSYKNRKKTHLYFIAMK